MAKLSRLGWIVAIIIALALSLYLSTMVFYTDTTLGNINMTIKCLILCGGGLSFFFVLLDTDACKSNYKLLMQLSFLHIIMQIVTIIFALILSLIAEIDTGGLTGVILICSIDIQLSLLAILINTDWSEIKSKINFTKRKNHMVNLSSKIKASLIIIDGEKSDKIKWK